MTLTIKNSIRRMLETVKATKGRFYTAVVMIMLPLLIINCYSFYSIYKDYKPDYSAFENFTLDAETVLNADKITEMYGTLEKALDGPEYESDGIDLTFSIISYVISIVADAFFILFAASTYLKEDNSTGKVLKTAVGRLWPIIIFGMLSSWVLIEAEGIISNSITIAVLSFSMPDKIVFLSSVASAIVLISAVCFALCFVMAYIYNMSASAVCGRTNTLLSFGYVREILNGKKFRTMIHIMPFIILNTVIPFILQGVAVTLTSNIIVAVIIFAIGTVAQVTLNAYTWFYVVPDFFELEQTSGIQNKIRDMMERIRNGEFKNKGNREDNPNSNDNQDNNSNDTENKE